RQRSQLYMPERFRMNIKVFVFIAVALLLASPREAFSQGAGTLRGTITDPSAAVVPGATVTAAGNGLNRTAKSDGQGHFTLPNVPAGKYNIRADAPGFVTFTRPDVEVPAGQASSLDIALQIATETQEIQVNDQAST